MPGAVPFGWPRAPVREAFTPPPFQPTDRPRTMKAETLLAQLHDMRKEFSDDKESIEYLTLHHVFCFVSYRMSDWQKYVREATERGELPAGE